VVNFRFGCQPTPARLADFTSARRGLHEMTPSSSPSRSGWVLWLHGDPLDLRFWGECFPERPVHIFEREGVFYCEADALDLLPDVKSVCEQGTTLLRIASAVLRLWRSRIVPLKVQGVMERYSDGSWGHPAAFVTISSGGWASSVYDVVGYKESPAELFMKLADGDERVGSALDDFASSSLDMPCLRRIAETIWTEFDPKNQGKATRKMVAAGLADKEPLDRFLNTVNRGAKAAHSPFRHPTYPDSMSLFEAQGFLARLLERWIRSKFPPTPAGT
jgi:hypothetical protein